MEARRLRIGELLIEAGVLTHAQLRQALDRQRHEPKPLGMILVESGFITEAQLIQALSRQLSIPWVSLWHVDVPPEVLAIVTREEAEKYRILPIYSRNVRGEKPTLFVAMDDPTNQKALDFVREVAGMEVRPMIAAPTDLREAIRALYSGEEEEEEREEPVSPPIAQRASPPPPPRFRPSPVPPTAPPGNGIADSGVATEPAGTGGGAPAHAGADAAVAGTVSAELQDESVETLAVTEPDRPSLRATGADEATGAAPAQELTGAIQSPEPRAAEVTWLRPAPETAERQAAEAASATTTAGWEAAPETPRATRARRQRRPLAFTFLDGTSIAIGGSAVPELERAEHASLANLVATLRRYADDPNVPEPYGPRGLSVVVATLLDILSRRGLLSEAEWAEAIARLGRGR